MHDNRLLRNATLAIIAGGPGARMGLPKAQLRMEGQPILSWFHRRLDWPGPTMVVTSSTVGELPGANCFSRICCDRVAGRGPLQGILTALENIDTPILVTIAVDMPSIETQHLSRLLDTLAAMPEYSGLMCETQVDGTRQIEPFPSVFRLEAKELVAHCLASGDGSVHGLCNHAPIRAMPAPADWPLRTWINLNSPSDVAEFHSSENPGRP